MTSTNWKELVHPGIVEFMDPNASLKDGVPNIAAITRAGIRADESGKYDNPRIFTNEEIQKQVALVHPGGTPINCIRWYRNNLGPRKISARTKFQDAYKYFKEQGNTVPMEVLAEIADANLHIIFGARGADISKISELKIMELYNDMLEEKKKAMIADKLARARAIRDARAGKTNSTNSTNADIADKDAEVHKTTPKLKKKK